MGIWPGRRRTGGGPHRVTMLGRSDCPLCDEALAVIQRVCADLGVPYEVRDIAVASPEEREEYWEKIPVTFIDGKQHDFWRVSEKRLREALS